MDRRRFLKSLIACPACASAAMAEGGAPHWTYEGEHGAAKWGEMDSKFKACAIGGQQSPVDLTGAVHADLQRVGFHWKPEAFDIANNGHTLQLTARDGGSIVSAKSTYTLSQFHFHTPSEHALAGRRAAMEAHFVHSSPEGRLIVIGVFMTAGKQHDGFAAIMRAAPQREGEGKLKNLLDPHHFLPQHRSFFRYEGSLTTPPCSETVEWNVFDTAIEVAEADILAFRALFPMNARPLQATNRRFLLKGH
jgi:carbonic anhydrase